MNAIEITETLRANFIRYLLTTFNVGRSEPELAEALRRSWEAPDALFRGPFLELNPPYAPGRSLRELADAGLVAEALCHLRVDIEPPHKRPLPPERKLYQHQERALRHVISGQRNLVVASGTGSGKTECFLLPILHDLFTDPTPGVRALLIYPMNALVNDQLERLRNLLRGTPITFGRYTSELVERETDGRAKMPDAPPNEIVSREAMRGSAAPTAQPPQILITNYAMLEYLLLRPEDSPLFESGLWRFICLDEAHTYTGAQGIEVSMLLRRLKHRLNKGRGQVRCIATSATLIKDDVAAAAEFAERLFGEPFGHEDVVFGETRKLDQAVNTFDPPPAMMTYGQFPESLRARLRAALAAGHVQDAALLQETAQALREAGIVSPARLAEAQQEAGDNSLARFLWAALKTNPQLCQLRALMADAPIELQTAGQRLFQNEAQDDADQSTEAVFRLVELGALARESAETAPLLPARYHLFARGPQGAWLCLNPRHPGREPQVGWSKLYLDKRERCDDCGAAVFELSVCRTCGQPYVRAFERESFFHTDGRHQNDTGGQRYFTWRPLTQEADAEVEEEQTSTTSAEAFELCLRCRQRGSTCKCQHQVQRVSLYQVNDKQERLFKCPRCATSSTQSEVATPVRLGPQAPLSVLTEDLYRALPASVDSETSRKPGAGRKLLCFSDSRQGAARYAAYLQETGNATLYRHLMARAARELNQHGHIPDLDELAERCVRLEESYGLFAEDGQYATQARRRRWRRAAKARILAEFCSRTDPRHSLLALGLVGCNVEFPMGAQPSEALCALFGLPAQAMLMAVQALLDTMRLSKAITLPDDIQADDEVFGAHRASVFFKRTRDREDKTFLQGWVGATARQNRFNYAQRILQATGRPHEIPDVKNALDKVWDWVKVQGVFASPDELIFQLRSDALQFPAGGPWYRCADCQRLTQRLLADELRLCPARDCNGRLAACEPAQAFTDDHYLALFNREPVGMRVEEHTAQLQPALGREYQESFIHGDINVLSCSTTFELGVDVGDLQTVVLNNVPPTVANYRQRAGRAGRRASGTAFILTYAALRPHDRVYFATPERIISGEVAVPRLQIENRVIAARHLNALLLSHFLRYLAQQGRVELGRCGAFFAPNLPTGTHLDLAGQWRSECGQELELLVTRFFAENLQVVSEPPAACVTRLLETLEKRRDDFEHWLSEYARLRNEKQQEANSARSFNERQPAQRLSQKFDNLRLRLLGEPLIDFLCREGVLPSYSFPIDVVELRLPDQQYRGDAYAGKALRLERDKKIAIVEYAPGAEVVADKHVWKSIGVVVRQQVLSSYEYRVCRTCRHLDRSPQRGIQISGACQVCGEPRPGEYPGEHFEYVDPDGFTTDWTAELRRAGLQVDLGVNRSRSFLLAEGEKVAPQALPLNGPPLLHYSYRRDGTLVAINSGANPEGFCLCERCGRQVESPRQSRNKRRKAADGHRTPWGEKCAGASQHFHLGHHFKTDTLHLRFESTANCTLPSGSEMSFWRSLTYALLEGASLELQIERRDLDGVVRPVQSDATSDPASNYSQEIVLFDNVPGGAGHVRHLADKLEAVLRRALVVVQCTCAEDTSCQNCLRNYGNQFYWEELKRGPVAVYLESLLIEAFPEDLKHLAVGATRVAALEKPRWLVQQMLTAEQEVWLAVKRITREQLQGETRNWLELLQEILRRGRRVSLCLPDLPPHDPARPDLTGLRNHLRLLVQEYGLKLFTLDVKSFPRWHIVLDAESAQGRAIQMLDDDCALQQRTGVQGLIYTSQPEAVKKIAAEINKLPRRVVTDASLAPPPNVRILHLRDGEAVTEASLFAELFQQPLLTLHINDRYLRSLHHEKRLRAYFALIRIPAGQKTRVTIMTMPAEVQPSNSSYYQTSAEQRQMFARLQQAFPHLDLQLRLERQLPHDRFLTLQRTDGTKARIGIGAGLDFIQSNGRTKMTDIIIEDPVG